MPEVAVQIMCETQMHGDVETGVPSGFFCSETHVHCASTSEGPGVAGSDGSLSSVRG